MSADTEIYYQDSLNGLISDLKCENARLRAERDRAQEAERQHAITIGVLREVVGSLWIVVHAAADEADLDSYLPAATYETVLDDCNKQMGKVNQRLGTGARDG